MLPAGSCVVDLIAGEALVRGPACDAALVDGWSYEGSNRAEVSCRLTTPRTETIQVAAGTFEAAKIQCQREFPSPKVNQTTTYWYAPTLGTMAKVVRRSVSATGELVFMSTEELVEVAKLP